MRRSFVMLALLPILAAGCGARVGGSSDTSQNGLIGLRGPAGFYLVSSQPSAKRLVPGTASAAEDARWSPDGRFLAFAQATDEGWLTDVYTVRADGSGRRLVMKNADSPSWSPSGERLAVVGDCNPMECPSYTAIYTVGADGSNPRRLTSEIDDPDGWPPVWSPNGKWIAYPTYDHRIAVRRPDGSGLSWVASYGEKDVVQQIVWSPDSEWLAFALNEAIYLVRTDGTALHRLARVEAFGLAWSPDGSTIAFDRSLPRPPFTRLTLIDTRTGKQWGLTQGPPVTLGPAWSPDGKLLAFLGADNLDSPADVFVNGRGADLWVVDADGTNATRLSRGWYGPVYGMVSWLPATERDLRFTGD